MKLNEILQLDCREKENLKMIRKSLLKTPFFKDIEDASEITIEMLEKILFKIRKKYDINLSYIMIGPIDEIYYSMMIKSSITHEWLTTVYSVTLFEGLAKAILFMFGYIKNKKENNNEN